ncbi:MAG: carboxylesterase/lipase family protein [Candidatus Binatia bacterium]
MQQPRQIVVIVLMLLVAGLAACDRKVERPPAVADPSTKRATQSGDIIGAKGDYGDHVWRGIPYAAPPVGPLRWRAPEPPAPWMGTREMLQFGAPCVQFANNFGGVPGKEGSVGGSEDCLFLNVYAPAVPIEQVPSGATRLPVMVWIHGGGNTIGHAGFYNGGNLASTGRVVVVTLNYRLGPFGWLRHAALREGLTPEEQSGNFALLDLIQALHWVQGNIAAFGGDPTTVTIFGESAGAQNVFALLLAPQARGLFHRAIAQSGGLWTSSPPEGENLREATPPGDARSSAELLLTLLERDGTASDRAAAKQHLATLSAADVAAYLRGTPSAALLAAYEPFPGNGMFEMPRMFADGAVLPQDDPLALYARADRWNSVPVMVGTTRDESKLFMFGDPQLVRRYFGLFPRLRDERMYNLTSEYMAKMWKATGADMPAAAMSTVQPQVFVYRFDWDEEPTILGADLSVMLGAAHIFEVPFVFGHFDLGKDGNVIFTENNQAGRTELSRAMMDYWAGFARYGQPAHGDKPAPEWTAWDPLSPNSPKFAILDTKAGGGVRMSNETLTAVGVMEALYADPRLQEPREECKPFPYDTFPWS